MGFKYPRMLLVLDDIVLRDAVEVAFRGEGFEVRAEGDGSSVEQIVDAFDPDVAILGMRLRYGLDGCGAVRRLRQVGDLPVVLLTSSDSLDDRLTGFQAGADDCLSEPFSMAELLARVEALLRRSGRWSAIPHVVGDVVVNDSTRTVTRNGADIVLTKTEFDLLSVLCHSPGHVVSKEQILKRLWGRLDICGANVVEVHLSALRRKLEAHGNRLIHTSHGGYMITPDGYVRPRAVHAGRRPPLPNVRNA